MDSAIYFLFVLQVGIGLIPLLVWILAGIKWYKIGQNGKAKFWKAFGISTPLMILSIVLVYNFTSIENGVPSKMILLPYPIYLCWGLVGLVLLVMAIKRLKKPVSDGDFT